MLFSQSQIVRLGNGHKVWIRRIGDQSVRMLLLHGGRLPAAGSRHLRIRSMARLCGRQN